MREPELGIDVVDESQWADDYTHELCFDCGHAYHGSRPCREVVDDGAGGGDWCCCGPIRRAKRALGEKP